MALTPYLAAFGAKMGASLERQDMKAMQPQEEETKELHDHVIIAGYGRAGQLIGQLLSENLIPFVALDVSNERVAAGKVRVRVHACVHVWEHVHVCMCRFAQM